jgi:hypothetical protein
LKKLRSLLAKGLDRTRALWPDIRRSFRWVHAAARILKNTAGRAADDVKTRYTRLLDGWRERRDACGTLGDAVDRFLKVTDRYRPGLFHYLEVPGLPATNNDLEQFFGAQRHHERRSGPGGGRSGQMARNPSPLETAPPRQGPALPLPPEPCRLPRRPRTARLPTAGFAALVFFRFF